MRTRQPSLRPVLTWPALLAAIALAVLAIAINLPSSATAEPGDSGNGQAALPPPVGDPAKIGAALKLDGIEGESTNDRHPGEIDILTWDWGVAVDAPSNPTLPVVGRPDFTGLTFTATTSKASPNLMINCVQGKHLKNAVLTVWRASADRQDEFYKITLNDVMITNFQQSGSAGTLQSEKFSLSFAQIIMEYRVQKDDGQLGDTVRVGWDVARNRPI